MYSQCSESHDGDNATDPCHLIYECSRSTSSGHSPAERNPHSLFDDLQTAVVGQPPCCWPMVPRYSFNLARALYLCESPFFCSGAISA